MKEPKLCCNCLHCARWKTSKGIECHCDLTDTYLGYLRVMDEENYCKHWEKETKWDLQRKHDSELLDKVAERINYESYCKDAERPCSSSDCLHCEYGYIDSEKILKVIADLKAEVRQVCKR